MSLILPYFKLDVIDWLKSEKIEVMSSACVGAYITLLCEAWTRPCCSLPSARLEGGLRTVMKLARWTGSETEFEPVLACFEPLKGDKTRMVNPRLRREWDATHAKIVALSEAGKRGAEIKKSLHAKKPRPSKPAAAISSAEFERFWEVYPNKVGKKAALSKWNAAKDRPALEEILNAVRRAQDTEKWKEQQGKYIPHPATWLHQGRWADQPISNGQNGSLLRCLICAKDYPNPAALKTHNVLYHPKYEG